MAIANGTCVSSCYQPKAHFGLHWVRPCDNRGKCHMDEKMIQCLSNASQHVVVSIYLQPIPSNSTRKFKSSPKHFCTFTSYSEMLVGNCNFSYRLYLTPPLGCFHWNSWKAFGPQKTRIMGLLDSEDSLTIGWAVSTQYQRVMDRRTGRRPAAVWLTHVLKRNADVRNQ